MTQTKTKKALLMSVLSMVLCVAMLVGMTFAWFTDTASTGVNIIKSGNLDVKLSYKAGETFKEVNSETAVLGNHDLWEPGHVEYAVLKVENAGTLALKYKLGINIASETGSTNVEGKDFKLSDYIKFAVVDGDKSGETRADLVADAEVAGSKLIKEGYTKESSLLAKAAGVTENPSETVTLVVWMPESVGNEANYRGNTVPTIELGIKVDATQYTYESDSFDDTYDTDATYPVQDAASLKNALDEVNASDEVHSAVFALTSDFEYKEPLEVSAGKDITIDLAGNNLKIENNDSDGITVTNGELTLANSGSSGTYIFDCNASNSDGIFVSNDEEGGTSTLNITGDVVINVDSRANTAIHAYAEKGNAVVNMDGATVTINGEKQTKGIVVDQNSTLNVKNTKFNLSADFDSYSDGNDVVGILLWGQNGKQENINVNIGEGTQISVGGKNAFAQGIQIGMKNGYSQELKVNVDGGEIILKPTENGKGYAFTTYKDVYGKFTMNAGTVSGNVTGLALAYIGTTDLTVNGGTFSVDPTAFLGTGHTATENNGTWTVK